VDDILVARYEQTKFRLECIGWAGYCVSVNWECEFELPETLEEEENNLRARYALYGVRTAATRLYYSVKEG
jgi:G:T-mismatch repair DNA endonuclease (very short patch repair protein)